LEYIEKTKLQKTPRVSLKIPRKTAAPMASPKAKPANPYLKDLSAPKNKPLDFNVGDRVKQANYGEGGVVAINPAGVDYEVTVQFEGVGQKKFMAHLAKLKKV